jgi:hypothetical protein
MMSMHRPANSVLKGLRSFTVSWPSLGASSAQAVQCGTACVDSCRWLLHAAGLSSRCWNATLVPDSLPLDSQLMKTSLGSCSRNRALSTGELDSPQLHKVSGIVCPPQSSTVQAQQERVPVKQELELHVKEVLHHIFVVQQIGVQIIMTLLQLAAYEGRFCTTARCC